MRVVNYSSLRANLKNELDRVILDSDVTIVARNGEENNVVIMSEEHYKALTETDYLLRSPVNKEHLLQSIEQDKAGDVVYDTLIK
jgi:antitoxin YefM